MPDGGELILTTRRDGRWVVLDVTDTGVGMTDEVRARIFDAFYSTRPGGSGLGLPTTRKIVEAHGGDDPRPERARQGLAVHDPAARAGA